MGTGLIDFQQETAGGAAIARDALHGPVPSPPLPAAAGERLPLLGQVLDALPDCVVLTDPAGRIHWTNRAFESRFSVPIATVRGHLLSVIAGPYAAQAEGVRVLEAVRTGSGTLEMTVFSREGFSFPCELRVQVMDGAPAGAERLVVLSDQTERLRGQVEVALKADLAAREREILRATTEMLDDGVLVVDDAERLVLANAAALSLFGLDQSAAHGRGLAELPLPSAVRGAWLAFLAGGQGASTQSARVSLDGSARSLLLRLFRVRSPRGTPLASALVVRDLTARAEPDRRRSDFMAQVSHELRTPLASIQGFVETMLDPSLPADLRHEFCSITLTESRRLGALIEDLLEVAQMDSGRVIVAPRPADLVAVAREALDSFTGEHAVIEADLPTQPVEGWIDPPQVRRLLRQLVLNAVDHGQSARGVRVTLRPSPEGARLAVRDWGPGVAPHDLERIFDPFFRGRLGVEEAPTGTGLGLPLCRQIVERHGGSIWAELPPDGGLRMVVDLPGRAPRVGD